MIERKYLAHYLDANFGKTTTSYVRLGKNLEEYNEELNPDVSVNKNIIGEQYVQHNGYEVQADVDPYYYEYDDTLSEKIAKIANERIKDDNAKTTMVDVLLKPGADSSATPTVVWAYREDVYIVPNSVGGDTSGVQIPFTVYKAGNRVKGTWDVSKKTFTPAASSLSD
ncbi:hypothetical protein [Blautia sp. MSJ-19]|uniref:hypothetical protein n=1 Tax=Blautia sp. MSJ-19 TaxID=2841517 RepID=UPI001C0EC1C0|nr:hypothetical protein [Blautia sp. MSJ-19]MBU5481737.1 hypothetical protein [Blautia sp. MSJ-19]